jgi:hypothetical protein
MYRFWYTLCSENQTHEAAFRERRQQPAAAAKQRRNKKQNEFQKAVLLLLSRPPVACFYFVSHCDRCCRTRLPVAVWASGGEYPGKLGLEWEQGHIVHAGAKSSVLLWLMLLLLLLLLLQFLLNKRLP